MLERYAGLVDMAEREGGEEEGAMLCSAALLRLCAAVVSPLCFCQCTSRLLRVEDAVSYSACEEALGWVWKG